MNESDTMDFTIDAMQPSDWEAVEAIYRAGILTGNATFETQTPSWETWHEKHLPHSRLVARQNGQVIGWTAISPVSSRPVYAGVAEESIYIAESARGQGVGKALLTALVESSEAAGIWTLQTGIFPENTVSLALHKVCGFRVLGVRERIGQMNGVWRDVVFLERRSQRVGI